MYVTDCISQWWANGIILMGAQMTSYCLPNNTRLWRTLLKDAIIQKQCTWDPIRSQESKKHLRVQARIPWSMLMITKYAYFKLVLALHNRTFCQKRVVREQVLLYQ